MAGLRARSSRRERLREDRAHLGRGDFRGEHMRTLVSLDQRHLGLGVYLRSVRHLGAHSSLPEALGPSDSRTRVPRHRVDARARCRWPAATHATYGRRPRGLRGDAIILCLQHRLPASCCAEIARMAM